MGKSKTTQYYCCNIIIIIVSRIKLNQTTRNVRNFKNEVYRDGATDA